jgi:hypothetical protein
LPLPELHEERPPTPFLEELKQQRLSILFNYHSTSTSSANIKKKIQNFETAMNYDDSDDDFQDQDDQL